LHINKPPIMMVPNVQEAVTISGLFLFLLAKTHLDLHALI